METKKLKKILKREIKKTKYQKRKKMVSNILGLIALIDFLFVCCLIMTKGSEIIIIFGVILLIALLYAEFHNLWIFIRVSQKELDEYIQEKIKKIDTTLKNLPEALKEEIKDIEKEYEENEKKLIAEKSELENL